MLSIASLILIALVALSYHQWNAYRSANAEAEHSRETVSAIDQVLTDLVDAETAQRGFLLTGEDPYLLPYNAALKKIPDDFARLGRLLGTSPQEHHQLLELHTLVDQRLDELRQTIDARRTQGADAAIALLRTNRGEHTMEAVRALCLTMRHTQDANQARASAGAQAAAGFSLLITVAGALALLFFFTFGFEPFASPDPQAWHRPWFLRYGAAVLGVVAITLLRAALTPLMDPIAMPFTLYFCAVAFAAWFGGFRPAVLSIVLSLLAGSWFFAAPTHSFFVSGHDDQTAMLMIVVVGFGIALLSRSQRTAVERARSAENAERAEHQRFETTLASIGDAVIATDAQGRVSFVNSIASALIQWPEHEAHGKPLDDVFHIVNEQTRAAIENPASQALREGHSSGVANHNILIGRQANEVPIDYSASPIRDEQGTVQGTVLVFRDISQRRQIEKQLAEQATRLEQAAAEARAQRQRLGLALTAGKMGAYEVEPSRKTLWWSPETYALFGLDPTEFKPAQDSFAALIHPEDRDLFLHHWNRIITEFQPINCEFGVLPPGGAERWISCIGTPSYDDAGSPVHYSGLFLDITERREAERMLREFERLSAAARLAMAIAHEINNPLNAVTNLVYLAKQNSRNPQSVAELLAMAEQELERVAHVARQALGFYRESSHAEDIDIAELIDSVLKMYSIKIEEKKINIVRSFQKCAPVYAVRGEIRQVLSNLLVNAIEAAPERGAIVVEAGPINRNHEDGVRITITDNGCGIAPEHLDRIFEPFFTTRPDTSTGLGLWVANEIVKRHHGSIHAEPVRGEGENHGASFTVELPRQGGQPKVSPAETPGPSVVRPERKRA